MEVAFQPLLAGGGAAVEDALAAGAHTAAVLGGHAFAFGPGAAVAVARIGAGGRREHVQGQQLQPRGAPPGEAAVAVAGDPGSPLVHLVQARGMAVAFEAGADGKWTRRPQLDVDLLAGLGAAAPPVVTAAHYCSARAAFVLVLQHQGPDGLVHELCARKVTLASGRATLQPLRRLLAEAPPLSLVPFADGVCAVPSTCPRLLLLWRLDTLDLHCYLWPLGLQDLPSAAVAEPPVAFPALYALAVLPTLVLPGTADAAPELLCLGRSLSDDSLLVAERAAATAPVVLHRLTGLGARAALAVHRVGELPPGAPVPRDLFQYASLVGVVGLDNTHVYTTGDSVLTSVAVSRNSGERLWVAPAAPGAPRRFGLHSTRDFSELVIQPVDIAHALEAAADPTGLLAAADAQRLWNLDRCAARAALEVLLAARRTPGAAPPQVAAQLPHALGHVRPVLQNPALLLALLAQVSDSRPLADAELDRFLGATADPHRAFLNCTPLNDQTMAGLRELASLRSSYRSAVTGAVRVRRSRTPPPAARVTALLTANDDASPSLDAHTDRLRATLEHYLHDV